MKQILRCTICVLGSLRAMHFFVMVFIFYQTGTAYATAGTGYETAFQSTVAGRVLDDSGEPLPGVSVALKGTSRGTVTNAEGRYTLSASPSDVLVFTFVGFKSQEVTVGTRATIDIQLAPDVEALEEVVVIGYGSQSKRELTSSVASISSREIKEMPIVGLDQSIQGRAAGVVVINNTGEPGGGVTIRIRGTSTIGSGSDPLYVVDGIPLDNEQTGNRNVGEARVNGLSQINPADIESIEILKDAAATAIYGARASNGVVLITTKRGAEGVSELSFDVYTGISEINKRYNLTGASDYATLVNEGVSALKTPPAVLPFSQEFIDNPTVDTDWQDEVLRTATVFNANVSLRGGNKSTGYMVSGGFLDQEGAIIETRFKRYSIRANVDHQVSKAVKIGATVFASFTEQDRSKNDGSASGADASNFNNLYGPPVLSSALAASPALPIFDNLGVYAIDRLLIPAGYINPVRQAKAVDIHNSVTRILPSLFTNINLAKSLVLTSRFSSDIRNETEEWFNPPLVNYLAGTDFKGQASQRTYSLMNWNVENFITYDRTIATNHDLSVMVGTSQQHSSSQNSYVVVGGIVLPDIPTLNAATRYDIVTSDKQAWSLASFFSRINYTLKDKYLLNINARYDGSSRFGKNNRFGFFPSAAVGWRISDEGFMDNISIINDLKLRASWGVTGNQSIGNYVSRPLYSVGGGLNTGNNYSGSTGASFANLASEDLRWEETTQLDIGLDVSILNNRLTITADYYVKTTDDLLFNIPMPRISGFDNVVGNVGKIENKGFEVGIESVNYNRNGLRWTTTFNIAANKNKVKELLGNRDVVVSNGGAASSIARVGHPISFYLYEREKYVNPETGQVILKDHDQSGTTSPGDMVLAGTPFPDFFGGINNAFSYKNFDLAIFFQYSYGNEVYNATRRELELLNLPTNASAGINTTQKAFDNRWKNPGDVTEYPKVNYNQTNNNFNVAHDGWLEDASYLRLKTLTLGYTVPKPILERAKMKNARVYFSSNNLITITDYSGYDPEVNHYTGVTVGGNTGAAVSNTGLLQGYDYGTYPQPRTFTVGLNLTF